MAKAQHEAVVAVPLKVLYDTILDFESYPKFSTGVKSSEIISRKGDTLEVSMDLEMIKRIQYNISVSHEMSPDASSAKIWWSLKSGDLFKKNDGAWTLTAHGPSSTKVTYSLDVEFNFSVPGFILKNLIKSSLPAAVSDFEKESQKRV